MKKRWIFWPIAIVIVVLAGFYLTKEKTQETQKMTSTQMPPGNVYCEFAGTNPLRREANLLLSEAVKKYYAEQAKESGFVESYDDIQIHSKLGKYRGSYVAFVSYKMKIKDIYTKVPGLGTIYITREGTSGHYQIDAEAQDEQVRDYAVLLVAHKDVQTLMDETAKEYQKAVQSDALLREVLADLQKVYEDSSDS